MKILGIPPFLCLPGLSSFVPPCGHSVYSSFFPCPGWLSFIHRCSDTTERSDPQGRHCSTFYGLRVPVMSLALHFGDHIQGTGHVIQREATQLYHLMGRKAWSMRDVIGITFGKYYQPHNPKAFDTLATDQACPHSPAPRPLSS